MKLHFAKTGTQVTEDANATVDAWITGGLQFANGAAYSYVVVVGTGSAREPWARNLHAAQVAVPLLDALLTDLEAEATGRKRGPSPPAKAKTPASAAAAKKPPKLTANRPRADSACDDGLDFLEAGLRCELPQPARRPLSYARKLPQRPVLELVGPELLFSQAQHDGRQLRSRLFSGRSVRLHIALGNGGPSLVEYRPQQGQNFRLERLGAGRASSATPLRIRPRPYAHSLSQDKIREQRA